MTIDCQCLYLCLKDGWLSLNELEGLNPNKISKISALARM